MTTHSNFYVQPFKWDESTEVSDDERRQIIHIWAKAIPVDDSGKQLCKEGTQTYLFRVLKYPSRVTIIFPDTVTNAVSKKEVEVTEKMIWEVRRTLEGWYTTMQGMRTIDRNQVVAMKGKPIDEIKDYFEEEYGITHKVIKFVQERRRKIYYYKRNELRPELENESWVLHIDLANESVSRSFLNYIRAGEYINGKRTENFTKLIFGNIYKFMQGFPGISAVQRLITDRKVSRCGWFHIRDAKLVKPAERICPNTPIVKEWRTELGKPLTITAFTPEYFVNPDSITPVGNPQVMKSLISRPSIVSWDIECYSDNSKAMPVPWNDLHVAYIITCVYQQYKLPETKIRKAFVFADCDTETPTEADGVTNSVVICRSEMEMIRKFSEFCRETDADILIGYNIFGFDVKYLQIRMEIQNQFWENMGRLKVNNTVTGSIDWASSAYGKNELSWIDMSGRMCHDMMKTIERDYKFSDYKLETVSQALLGKGKNDVSPQEMFKIFESGDPKEMLRVVNYALQDSVLPIELFEKINGWAFMTESANVMCVNPMDLFIRGQQIRLMNQFYDKCFPLMFVTHKRDVNIVPVEGAYVVDPVRGLHENVMTLDFASLYPSIMIAHNIGHDTLVTDPKIPDEQCHVFEWTDEDESTLNKEGMFVPDPEKPEDEDYKRGDDEGGQKETAYKICKNGDGKWRFRFIKEEYGHRSVAATMLVDLLAERKRVRKEQKTVKDSDPVYYEILEQRQKAIKVSCNSVYGMTLAQATGKLPLAEGGMCVTFRGRQLNLEMQKLAREKYGAETVYGDTDSIMVKTAYTKLMVEAARKFSTDKPSIEEINNLASEMGIKDYSSETAMRFLEHYHGFKEEHEVCNEMGEHIAVAISDHLPRPISLEFENVFVKALFLLKKRYACVTLDRDNMVIKNHPMKIYAKGIMLARRDNCKWARDTFRDVLFNILQQKPRNEISDIVHGHLERLVTGGVDIRDLEIIQKLGFDYKSPTFPLKIFSEHLKEIGKPARPNDRLAFIVGIKPNSLAGNDPKLGHYYRLTETIKEEMDAGTNDIDYMYYIDRLTNDIDQIFSVGYMLEIERENEVRLNNERRGIQEVIDGIQTEIIPCEEKLETLPEDTPKQRREKKDLARFVKNKKMEIDKLKKKLTVLNEARGGVDKAIQKIRGKNSDVNLRLTENMYSSHAEMFRVRLSNKNK